MAPPRRAGLTLVEFLVAVAAVVILLGLLLPAVQKVREAADRAACANNLKRIGQAFLSHHDTLGAFPDGGKNKCDRPYSVFMPGWMRAACDADPHHPLFCYVPYHGPFPPDATLDERRAEWSWPYQILPYLDQQALHRTASDAAVIRTPLKAYHCPSRRPPRVVRGHATIDYAGCAGTGDNGIVVRRGTGPVTAARVSDGLSTTVLAGDKRMKLDWLGRSRDDNEGWAQPGWDEEVYRVADADPDRPDADRGPSPDIAKTTTPPFTPANRNAGLRQFGSSHPKGANLVLGDGSVRHIRFNPDPVAFQRFCVRDDGLNVANNDF